MNMRPRRPFLFCLVVLFAAVYAVLFVMLQASDEFDINSPETTSLQRLDWHTVSHTWWPYARSMFAASKLKLKRIWFGDFRLPSNLLRNTSVTLVGGAVMGAGTEYIDAFRSVVQRCDISFIVDIDAAEYVWQHIGPLIHILPMDRVDFVQALDSKRAEYRDRLSEARAFGIPHNSIKGAVSNEWVADRVSKGAILLGLFQFGLNLETTSSLKCQRARIYCISHGFDEDDVYSSLTQNGHTFSEIDVPVYDPVTGTTPMRYHYAPFQTMMFSSYLRANTVVDLVKAFRLVATLPTLLYTPTTGEASFFDGPNDVYDRSVIEALQNLTSVFNVVVRYHPLSCLSMTRMRMMRDMRRIAPDVKFDDPDNHIGLMSWLTSGLVTVAIVEVGASASVAAAFDDICLVYLRPEHFRKRYHEVFNDTLNNDMATAVWGGGHQLSDAVMDCHRRCGFSNAAALNNSRSNSEYGIDLNDDSGRIERKDCQQYSDTHLRSIEPRHRYVQRLFGDIDGFEEYRVATRILSDLARDVPGDVTIGVTNDGTTEEAAVLKGSCVTTDDIDTLIRLQLRLHQPNVR